MRLKQWNVLCSLREVGWNVIKIICNLHNADQMYPYLYTMYS
jgi:hypothetical protein